ncbi:MAG: hypothetical protein J5940_02745 [Clostridia bacterium]|nr:hypothetical protein [Clostridia bacterium]
MKKLVFLMFAAALLFTASAFADETSYDLRGLIPDDIAGDLPDDYFYGDGENSAELPDTEFIIGYAMKALKSVIPGAVKSMALILGVSLIASMINVISSSFSPATAKAVTFITSVCVCGAVYSVLSDVFGGICEYVDTLRVFIDGFMPIMTGAIALSGNVTTASVTGIIISLAITVLEALSGGVLLMLLKVCFCFSVTTVIPGSLSLGEISALIKRVLTHVLAFVMLVMSVVTAYQTLLAKSADSAILKGMRFAAGSYIPVIGNSVGESLNLIAAGLSAVRAAVGAAGCAVIVILLIIPLIRVIFYRLAFDLCSAIAGITGLQKEGAFMREMSSLAGLGLAIMTISSVFFMLLTVVATKI